MIITNDGGPAFPGPCQHETRSDIHEGMSLRDWFAGQALTGLLAKDQLWSAVAGREAYEMADAMLKAREAGNGMPPATH